MEDLEQKRKGWSQIVPLHADLEVSRSYKLCEESDFIFTPLLPGIRVSGYTVITIPEAADSDQLTALYHQARRDKPPGKPHTPDSDAHLEPEATVLV